MFPVFFVQLPTKDIFSRWCDVSLRDVLKPINSEETTTNISSYAKNLARHGSLGFIIGRHFSLCFSFLPIIKPTFTEHF